MEIPSLRTFKLVINPMFILLNCNINLLFSTHQYLDLIEHHLKFLSDKQRRIE